MAFHIGGHLNGIAKRSQGVELISGGVQTATAPKKIDVWETNPGTLVLTSAQGPGLFSPLYNFCRVVTSPSGTYMVSTSQEYPYYNIYKKVNGAYTQLPTPTGGYVTLTTNNYGYAVAWSPDETQLFIGFTASPWGLIFSRSGDTFTVGTISLQASSTNSAAFDPTGQFLAIGTNNTPFCNVYSVSGTTYTKITASSSQFSSSLPSGAGYNVSWSPNDNLLAVVGSGTPYISLYGYTPNGVNTVFWKCPAPSTIPTANIYSVAFNNTSTGAITTASIALGTSTSPFLEVYNLSLAGTATTMTQVFTSATNMATTYSVAWNSNGTQLYAAVGNQNYLMAYNRVGNTFNQISTATWTKPTPSVTTGVAVDYNTTTNALTIGYGSYPFVTEFNPSNNFSDNDCWGRKPLGYSTASIIAITSGASSYVNAYYSALFNPGGTNPPNTILIHLNITTNTFQPHYYNRDQKTFTPINTAITAPSVGATQLAVWRPDGTILSIIGQTSPYVAHYAVTGVGTGTTFTKLTAAANILGWDNKLNGAGAIPSAGNSYYPMSWSSNSQIFMYGGTAAPYLFAYYTTGTTAANITLARLTSTNFISSTSGVAISTTGTCSGSGFSPDSSVFIDQRQGIATGGLYAFNTYNVSYNGTATTFTRNWNLPASWPAASLNGVYWTNDGKYLAMNGYDPTGVAPLVIYYYDSVANTFKKVSPARTQQTGAQNSMPVFTNDGATMLSFGNSLSPLTVPTQDVNALTHLGNTTTFYLNTMTVFGPLVNIPQLGWGLDA